ncbi:matrixin family metalloprotease [Paenibacillus taichungensis]|uniref:matrixin family metalloprotease n=1 Tax=Paenibacillus TaxID=44249 RepID=UPI00237C18CE|nr:MULTISPECIES: matrixin family metalloprotease [Paenibacillus]MEC0106951.1 matrixin family metalloprotease [Paenibacillus taichungensis]MEC0195119.1 matrixin family metalloprotease [Paenibacillus taichungensis]WDQ35112.1 matrixin family metalloprotease [Paenibacillus marchantiae]
MRTSKTFKKIIILSLAILPLSLGLLQSDADAVRFSGGRTSATYNVWYSDSVSSYGYVSAIDEARFKWNDTSTKVNLTRVLSSTGTPDKYYVGTTAHPTWIGLQEGYKLSNSGGYVIATGSETWSFSNIRLFHNNMYRFNMTTSQIISNATHEYGHALGLDHTPDSGSSSVMKSGIQDIGPTTYDIQEIRLKWGN